jgi:hypothetical protein
LVYLRPALLAAHPEGEKALAALGPWGQGAADALRLLTHAELPELDEVLVAILARPDGKIDASLRVGLVVSWDDAELARRWPESQTQQRGDHAFRVAGERACFLTPEADANDGAGRTRGVPR